jgi:hypothetical protein
MTAMTNRILSAFTAVFLSLESSGFSRIHDLKSSEANNAAFVPFSCSHRIRGWTSCSSENDIQIFQTRHHSGLLKITGSCCDRATQSVLFQRAGHPIRIRGGGDLLGMDEDFDDENEETVGEWMGTGLKRLRICHG